MRKENVSYWTKSSTFTQFPQLSQDLQADVLVVGGGIAGILAAYQLAKAGREVTVLEGQRLAQVTTAGTTAKITAQHHLQYQDYIKQRGEKEARLFYESQCDGIEILRNLADQYDIDCDMETLSSIQVTIGESEKKIKKEYKAYQQLGINGTLHEKDMGLPFETTMGLEMFDQAQFHPLKFLAAMVDVCVELGVTFYEETMVKKIDGNTVETENGMEVAFNQLICATHYPIANLKHNLLLHLEIERSYIVAAKDYTPIPYAMFQVADMPERSLRHYITEDGIGLLIGGENHVAGAKDDVKLCYERLAYDAEHLFNAHDIADQWSAQDMMTQDKMPLIGRYSKSDDHIFIITGFNKFGIATSAVGSVVLRDLLMGQPNKYEELLQPGRIDTIGSQAKATAKKAVNAIRGQGKAIKDYRTDREALKEDEAGIFLHDGRFEAVYKDDEGTEHAVSPFCTHMGCVLSFNNGEKTWDCACHGSRFDCDGKVLHGPASVDLKQQ
ncbi:FAD-dependent oxidoreductase [Macrococcus equipercicus]|uniref:FAD-dependent oxidoreductase n=1 Tax=Macrococcus equipercicus TaxID=69967 RepID=A0A9Q9F1D9_9STAP|nr:FAD-dependent oxidoreductase [Macrococcus equipercicus]KAA1039603.1 FAD-dependent oxidoreductase [Macrococcus equipercicus]UTH13933.1 FAD-dependent oxidoreductase [Macrococcus equipercicus]